MNLYDTVLIFGCLLHGLAVFSNSFVEEERWILHYTLQSACTLSILQRIYQALLGTWVPLYHHAGFINSIPAAWDKQWDNAWLASVYSLLQCLWMVPFLHMSGVSKSGPDAPPDVQTIAAIICMGLPISAGSCFINLYLQQQDPISIRDIVGILFGRDVDGRARGMLLDVVGLLLFVLGSWSMMSHWNLDFPNSSEERDNKAASSSLSAFIPTHGLVILKQEIDPYLPTGTTSLFFITGVGLVLSLYRLSLPVSSRIILDKYGPPLHILCILITNLLLCPYSIFSDRSSSPLLTLF